ncbi:MAG: sugar ABC transporter permease [Ruminococcus sp.]|nr:sugar ABC transporter permease [Ruminococcus sp.]MDO4418867.1 sugar ABC transporter permease [Ruminococcus sp.]
MIKSYKLRRTLSNTAIYILLAVLGIIWIFPLVWLVLHSFRINPNGGAPAAEYNHLFPSLDVMGFDNYIGLFTETKFMRWFGNTFLIAVVCCIISTISVLVVAYAFSRLRFKARKPLINVGMIMGMFPGFMTMIALYLILKMMGLDQTLGGLILCYSAGSGLGYLVMKGYLDTIPHALDEAATIDGANKFQVFYKIILPMAKPMIIYQVLTSFISPWCDFILVNIIMRENVDNYTVAKGLWSWAVDTEYRNDNYRYFLSGSVIVSIPITALFLYMQKYYVEGVTAGGVKG